MRTKYLSKLSYLLIIMNLSNVLFSQKLEAYSPNNVSITEYDRAANFFNKNAEQFTSGTLVEPKWIDSDRFWFRNLVFGGHEFILIDIKGKTRSQAFDHSKLAASLSSAKDTTFASNKLPFNSFEYIENNKIRFYTKTSERWEVDLNTYELSGPDSLKKVTNEVYSPDRSMVAFSRNENLWVRNLSTGKEKQLSKNGEEHFGYGVVGEGCCREITNRRNNYDPPATVSWSPNGKKIATHRFDERKVEDFHLLEAATGRAILHSWKYPLPGDENIPTWQLHVFDVKSGAQTMAKVDPIPAGFSRADTLWKSVKWTKDVKKIFFTSRTRDFQKRELFSFDVKKKKTKSIIVESNETYVELNQMRFPPNWRVLKNGKEILWFSERDGWGHLYLYNGNGKLKKQITKGDWLVLEVLLVDEKNNEVFFTGVGREKDRDPYLIHLYKASLNTGKVTLLSSEDAHHIVKISPNKNYFIDTYSTRSTAPVTVVRDLSGKVLMTVEEANIDPLLAEGWNPPIRFKTKGRDGYDFYGYITLPKNLKKGVKYPVIDYIYPGPQIGPIRTHGFTTSPSSQGHALAELGFIVFVVDALGTPYRSKKFHDGYYADMGDNGLPDHISALRELAKEYPIDLDRVGIYGHSGGGFSSTDAILRHPDFFKVAVSGAGNHDNRGYYYEWGEKYQGLLKQIDESTDTYDSQANQNIAANLKGKLLLTYGSLDDNVHPNLTLLVADELIKHNKDFDMLVLPNRNHGYAREEYIARRTWDYFVMHLMGSNPPKEYKIEKKTSNPNMY